MLLNRFEKALMNNPVRAAVQRRVEARWLLALGGRMAGGRALWRRFRRRCCRRRFWLHFFVFDRPVLKLAIVVE